MTRMVNTLQRRSQARRLSVLLTAIGASLLWLLVGLVGTPPTAKAASTGCTQRCVILIEVNGLEPKDVTKANTPFLWALAHSGDGNNDPQANSYPALAGRNGWAWQAARTVMSTGDGPSTQALLTGDTAEQSADPADLFAKPSTGPDGKTTLTYYKTGGSSGVTDACGGPAAPCDPASENLLGGTTILSQALSNNKTVGIWLGDPALCTIVNSNVSGGPQLLYDKVAGTPNSGPLEDITKSASCPDLWAPFSQSSASNPSPPGSGFCPPPTSWPTVNGTAYYPAACPVSDGQVLSQAGTDLGQASNGYPDLSFLYLPDVGRAKQAAGDSDCFADPGLAQQSCGAAGTTTEPPSVSRALHTTDAQLAAFASALYAASAQNSAVAWQNTYLMVVGSHGYETTPAPLRVPDPNAMPNGSSQGAPPCSADQGGQAGLGDLSCFVAEDSGSKAVLVPQGTMATVYYQGPNDPQDEETTLHTLVDHLCAPRTGQATCSPNSQVNGACQQVFGAASSTVGTQAVPNCIEKVYYVDPSFIPASDASQYAQGQFLFGMPGDPGYRTASNPTYDPNPDCQSTDPGSLFYDASGCDSNLLGFYKNQLASWHLNVLNSSQVATDPNNPQTTTTVFAPSGASGQLVVVFGPGWAAGPLASVSTSPNNGVGGSVPGGTVPGVTGNAGDPIDPYTGSSGGPRDRAIAAIINGPSSGSDPVVQFPDTAPGNNGDGLAPVTNDNGANPAGNQPYVCSPSFMSGNPKYAENLSSASFAVDQANADPSNDGAAFGSPVFNSQFDSYVPSGHECQADIIDFAPTIEGLLSIPAASSTSDQADARVLDEAFAKCLGENTSDSSGPDCGNQQTLGKAAQPPPPPPPQVITPPQITIVIPPKPPKPYNFRGLIRHAQAQVVDQSNHTVPFARPGAYLSSVRITADFGKPHSQVTITLYKRAHPAGHVSAHASRVSLTTVVRFCPFTVTRAPNVQLRFEVPTAYKPDHVGLAVREVHMLHSATGPGCGKAKHNAFAPFGPTAGVLVPILDARLLHKLKPCPSSLSFPVPQGPGIKVESADIVKRGRVVRAIPKRRLASGTVTLPAARLPGGYLRIRVQWYQSGKRRTTIHTYLSGAWNCTAHQRRKLGTG